MATATLETSRGHICFAGDFEFFQDDAGEVYRAHTDYVIGVDGYRAGRWECSIENFRRYESVIIGQLRTR